MEQTLLRRGERAYAKLNLTLGVLGRRADGYHDMRMLMQTVTLFDELTLTRSGAAETRTRCSLSFLPADGRNLATAAADAFWRAVELPVRALDIEIEKRIPVCAGLAGGSADAAAVLRVLRDCYAPGLTDDRLSDIGAAVGSDVPYCVLGGTMLAEGRGEQLTPLPPLPDCHIVLCKPDFSVSTAGLFARLDKHPVRYQPDTLGAIEALRAGDLSGVARRIYNVFEEALPPRRAERVRFLKDALVTRGALGVGMSGTGPSVFGIFDSHELAQAAAEEIEPLCFRLWLVQSISPRARDGAPQGPWKPGRFEASGGAGGN